MSDFISLNSLGWQAYFQQQLSLDEWDEVTPARVIEQHRSELGLLLDTGSIAMSILPNMPELVVGDWLLLDKNKQFLRSLERKTCFSRKAAGSKVKRQLISANVDTAFILCSMNDDFNLNRIERFLSLVNESGAEPVIVLSKSDQALSPEDFMLQVRALDPLLSVEAINCLDATSCVQLSPWLKAGVTIAVLGSSGVGKSTLINTLLGKEQQQTAAIREDDNKGRHTTTSRSLMTLAGGALILDTPGMREIQLEHCKEGIATTFSDIEGLAQACHFADCRHQSEPDCAVRAAVEAGVLEPRRLQNYHKLLKEEALNSASLSERRASDKALGKFYKTTLKQSKELKGH